jgi:anthranilate synthase component 1
MYFFNFTDFQVVGASPEMLVRVDNVRRVETCPIAGTRKRGSTPEEDTVLARELLEDEKEVAEHMMLVDLGRNDIGRVAVFGSVKVDHLKKIEKYSHVMHIVSNVSGILDEGKDALDALSAVFPAGTLTGAPKVRAMELIDAYETLRRGIYGGAAGYISFDGSMDFCIIIRTFLFRDGVVSMQSGGGIVYDSVAEKEFEEAENKVKVLRQALIKAGDFK